MGAYEACAPAWVEATLKYHPETLLYLTSFRYPEDGPGMVGSLTGAVASQKVPEARNGRFSVLGNRGASSGGANLEIPPLRSLASNRDP